MNKLILSFILVSSAYANFVDSNVKKMNWGDLEVVWVKDNSFPTYDLSVYFSDGAMSETKKESGVTNFMFQELTSGTTRYNQKEILNSLEFYGTSFHASVTHEFSTYSMSGLTKDLDKNLKMVCHLFNNATFPKSELKKSKRRAISGFNSLVTNHQALSSRIFRELSLRGTPYSRPVEGYINTIKSLKSKTLSNRLTYMNKVKKRIYLRGSKDVLKIEDIIKNDCKWTTKSMVKTTTHKNISKKTDKKMVYLVSVPKANQAQIRIGKTLTKKEIDNKPVELAFSSKYLGGGFTSRLMQEVRVKRGLTYSIGAYASGQKEYGRSGISTFTKNETLAETLSVIKKTVDDNSKNILKDKFDHSMRYIKGNYLLGLESTSEFMNTLMHLDHQQRSYNDIYEFKEKLSKITRDQLAKRVKDVYSFDSQLVMVLGDKSLYGQLKKAGYKVKKVSYKKFL